MDMRAKLIAVAVAIVILSSCSTAPTEESAAPEPELTTDSDLNDSGLNTDTSNSDPTDTGESTDGNSELDPWQVTDDTECLLGAEDVSAAVGMQMYVAGLLDPAGCRYLSVELSAEQLEWGLDTEDLEGHDVIAVRISKEADASVAEWREHLRTDPGCFEDQGDRPDVAPVAFMLLCETPEQSSSYDLELNYDRDGFAWVVSVYADHEEILAKDRAADVIDDIVSQLH